MIDKTVPTEDKTLWCVDCQRRFLFTSGEQKYFQDRGLTEPKRCLGCRQVRRDRLPVDNSPLDDNGGNR